MHLDDIYNKNFLQIIFYLSGLYSVDKIIPEVHPKEILFIIVI